MRKTKRRAQPGAKKGDASANVMPNHIKEMRLLKGYSRQVDLAEVVGVSTATVCYWETGLYCPTPHMMKRLVQVLGCTLEELFDWEAK